jgi:hypothetical protein
MNNLLLRRAPILMLLVLSSAVSGCGGSNRMKTAIVKGQVTYKGRPVPNGTVLFIPSDQGPSATGELQKDGTYVLTTHQKGDGAVLGKHNVVIVAMEDTSDKLPEQRNPLPPSIVPDRYTSAATTDLTAEVKDVENVIDFNLGGERKR